MTRQANGPARRGIELQTLGSAQWCTQHDHYGNLLTYQAKRMFHKERTCAQCGSTMRRNGQVSFCDICGQINLTIQ